MAMIFDTHAHYLDEQFDADRGELLSGLKAQGVGRVTEVSVDNRSSERAARLAADYDFVYAAVGFHPDETGGCAECGLDVIERLTSEKKVVAIGEIGLDYHWMVQEKSVQEKWFRAQLRLAAEKGLPVIIHSREAAEDTLRILKEENAGSIGGVAHCFSYSAEMAAEYLRLGFFIGVGGVLTYKNGRRLKEVCAAVPLESIVLETDCPYLSPEPFRGRRNNSANIRFVAEALAAIKNISAEEVIAVTERNAERLYRL